VLASALGVFFFDPASLYVAQVMSPPTGVFLFLRAIDRSLHAASFIAVIGAISSFNGSVADPLLGRACTLDASIPLVSVAKMSGKRIEEIELVQVEALRAAWCARYFSIAVVSIVPQIIRAPESVCRISTPSLLLFALAGLSSVVEWISWWSRVGRLELRTLRSNCLWAAAEQFDYDPLALHITAIDQNNAE